MNDYGDPIRPQDPEGSEPRSVPLVSRRVVFASAAAAIVPLSVSKAFGQCTPDNIKSVEGYFLVFTEQGGGATAEDRIFFIASEWLKKFEVTDFYRKKLASEVDPWHPKQVADKLRKSKSQGKKVRNKLAALYATGDDLTILTDGTNSFCDYVRPSTLPSDVYIAAMIPPGNIPTT